MQPFVHECATISTLTKIIAVSITAFYFESYYCLIMSDTNCSHGRRNCLRFTALPRPVWTRGNAGGKKYWLCIVMEMLSIVNTWVWVLLLSYETQSDRTCSRKSSADGVWFKIIVNQKGVQPFLQSSNPIIVKTRPLVMYPDSQGRD